MCCVREDFHLCKILSAEEHIPSTVRGMVNFEKSKYLYNIVSQVLHVRSEWGYNSRVHCVTPFHRLRVLCHVCVVVGRQQLMQHQEHPYNLQPVSKIIDLLSATVYQLNDS